MIILRTSWGARAAFSAAAGLLFVFERRASQFAHFYWNEHKLSRWGSEGIAFFKSWIHTWILAAVLNNQEIFVAININWIELNSNKVMPFETYTQIIGFAICPSMKFSIDYQAVKLESELHFCCKKYKKCRIYYFFA